MNALLPTPIHPYARGTVTCRIVSFLDMLQIQTDTLLAAMSYLGASTAAHQSLADMAAQGRQMIAEQPLDDRARLMAAIKTLETFSEQFDLPVSHKMATRAYHQLFDLVAGSSGLVDYRRYTTIAQTIKNLIECFVTETSERKFYSMMNQAASFHKSADDLFGKEVINTFPHIAFDAEEAGKCISFGLWTAAVMHTMRLLEGCLTDFANHLGVTHKVNWNQTLNLIEAKLREVRKATNGSDAEQWAAEAGTHLRFVKNAWRNNAMHPHATYDEARAKDIFRNAQSFAAHLAEKLSTTV